MIRQAVKSSNLAEVGYDPMKEVLEVRFQNDAIYSYEKVSLKTYIELIGAHSIGAYFRENVMGQYPTTMLQDRKRS